VLHLTFSAIMLHELTGMAIARLTSDSSILVIPSIGIPLKHSKRAIKLIWTIAVVTHEYLLESGLQVQGNGIPDGAPGFFVSVYLPGAVRSRIVGG